MAVKYRLPFSNPNLVDGFGSLGFWSGGKWVKRARPHQGVDFPAGHGSPIPAIAAGTIADVVHSDELGWITVVRHERGVLFRPAYSFSCHQSERPQHGVGWKVVAGATIGHVGVQGRNGSAAQGEHLHLAMSYDVKGGYQGRVFDPIKWINARRAADQPKVVKPKTYTVRKGDYLGAIANKVRVPEDKLVHLNGIRNRDLIYPGQVLKLS